MDQVLAIQKVREKIQTALQHYAYKNPADMQQLLEEIDHDLYVFLDQGVDFKIAMDALDDSIFITDKDGICLYVNPAHQRNTTILPEEVLGRSISDIIADGNLFTGGATLDVMKTREKQFRLATVTKMNPPSVGYAVGTPIFDDEGNLFQVVVSSRPILSLQSLQEDYEKFLQEINAGSQNKETVRIVSDANQANRMVGSSLSLQQVWSTIQMAAPTDATVLITGESGVGKEVVADEIYRLSDRSDKTFIKVNCASIPANLLESELFGYEKGAFSGANAAGKQGLFELANGGTLLLDEIGDMPMDLQVKLLRAIQQQEITRVGGTKPIKLNIRFISATNSDLKKKISEGTFRQDLFYRLNVIPINIPPLRQRLSDIEELSRHFIRYFSQKHHRTFDLTEDHLNIMRQYSWPGNIRELENVMEYLTICAAGTKEGSVDMLKGLLNMTGNEDSQVTEPSGTLTESMENYEKKLIESVLKSSHSLRDAGNRLGVNASTISRKIKQYGIDYNVNKPE